jgi:hypothetical protein
MLADVRPVDSDERDFELVQIGLGICVPKDEDHDIVVAADRLDALGLHFSVVQRAVLDAAEAEMAEGRVIARTPTFALFRSPVTVVVANEHRKANLYYAFCVERLTGRLHVAVWMMRSDSKSQQPPTAMVKLGSNLVFNCDIDVRAKRILGTIPFSWSFAMRSLPPGHSVRVPPSLGVLIESTARHPADADLDEFERLLIQTLVAVPGSDGAKDNPLTKSKTDAVDQSVRKTAIPPPYRRTESE